MTQHPFTLHESDDAKVVQLSGEYSLNWGCSIEELKVAFYQSGNIELHRFDNDDGGKITRFSLSEEEAAAFFEAYETFKAEKELKKLAEAKHIQDIVDNAQRMLAELPIFIEKHPETDSQNSYWTIRSSEFESIKYTAYGADQLLERTKMAVKDYERHLVEQAIHDEVKAIKERCPAIKIHGNPKQAPWHVNIPEPDIYGEWARHPEELLERVKAAKAKYEQWQVEQDEMIKTND